MYYVYLLESQKDKSWYTGYTSNLKRRLKQHKTGNGGQTTSRKITVQHGEVLRWKLIYYEAYLNKSDAVGREKFLKSGSGRNFLKKQLTNYLILR